MGNTKAFTWFKQFGDCAEKMPREKADEFIIAVVRYGMTGEEPQFDDWALDSIFESVRGDIDLSVKSIENGGKGGRPSKKQRASETAHAEETAKSDNSDSHPAEPAEPMVSMIPKPQSTEIENQGFLEIENQGFAENENHGFSENAKPKTRQDKIGQDKEKTYCPAQAPDPVPYSEIIGYLNERLGTQFKPSSKNNRKLIKARWNEGFRVDDFKAVIDSKAAQWLNDPDMSRYLKPDTIFGPKFEGYLNTAPLAIKAKQHTSTLGGSHAPDYSREGW